MRFICADKNDVDIFGQKSGYFLLEELKMKRVFTFVILGVILFLIQGVVHAQPLSPFGKFEWSDNIVDVFTKLKNYDSLENIHILGVEGFEGINALDKTNADLIAGIKESVGIYSKILFEEVNKELILKDGKKTLYHTTNFEIRASPVILAGIPFRLDISFKNVPGYILSNPDKVIKIKVDGMEIMILLQLEKIEFSSQNVNLVLMNHQNLYNIIREKYPAMVNEWGEKCNKLSDFDRWCEVKDGDYSVGFRFGFSKDYSSIYYKNSLESIGKTYIDHSNIMLSRELETSDSSSDL